MSYLQNARKRGIMEVLNSWDRGVLLSSHRELDIPGHYAPCERTSVPPTIQRRWQILQGAFIMETKALCNVEGCDGVSRKRGMCEKHYHRWRKLQTPGKLRDEKLWRQKNRPSCSVEGCRRPHEARGLCSEHYKKWQRSQNPEKLRAQVIRWRQANPEKRREYQRKWKQAHLENGRASEARRKARQANTVDALTLEETTAILARGCFFLHLGDCEGQLCIAHNIPISKGGNTTEANVFCLCRRHNLQMRTKSLSEMFGQLALAI